MRWHCEALVFIKMFPNTDVINSCVVVVVVVSAFQHFHKPTVDEGKRNPSTKLNSDDVERKQVKDSLKQYISKQKRKSGFTIR